MSFMIRFAQQCESLYAITRILAGYKASAPRSRTLRVLFSACRCLIFVCVDFDFVVNNQKSTHKPLQAKASAPNIKLCLIAIAIMLRWAMVLIFDITQLTNNIVRCDTSCKGRWL